MYTYVAAEHLFNPIFSLKAVGVGVYEIGICT